MHAKKKSLTNLILTLVYRTSGKWTWYQIERELSFRGIGGMYNAVVILDHLVEDGLVEREYISGRIDPVYHITEAGRERVQELVDEYGPEFFMQSKENRDDYEI
jgi:DNA-binding PadR family transcriptional regulator